MTIPACLESADRQVTDDRDGEGSGDCSSRDAAGSSLHEQISLVPTSTPHPTSGLSWRGAIKEDGCSNLTSARMPIDVKGAPVRLVRPRSCRGRGDSCPESGRSSIGTPGQWSTHPLSAWRLSRV